MDDRAWSDDARFVRCAYGTENVIDEPAFCPFVMLHELDAVIREHCVDLVGYCFDQGLEEAGCYKLCRLAIDSSYGDLRSAIGCDKEEGLAALISQTCNIDMEIADFVGFEALRLFTVDFGKREIPWRCKER